MNGKRRNLLKNITDFRCGWPLEGKNTGNPAYYARAVKSVGIGPAEVQCYLDYGFQN